MLNRATIGYLRSLLKIFLRVYIIIISLYLVALVYNINHVKGIVNTVKTPWVRFELPVYRKK